MILRLSYRDHRETLMATGKGWKNVTVSASSMLKQEKRGKTSTSQDEIPQNMVNRRCNWNNTVLIPLTCLWNVHGTTRCFYQLAEEALEGSHKFLDRVYRLITSKRNRCGETMVLWNKVYNKTVKACYKSKIESMKFQHSHCPSSR